MQLNRSTGSIGAVACLILGALAVPHSNGQPPPARAMSSAKKFKNIKILKDLPADQMIPTMQKISRSLGVRCEFCHVEPNMASDAKPEKNVARQMLVMTNNLNKNVRAVDNKVTCFMCHRGSAVPNGTIENARGRGGERGDGPRPD